MVSERRACRALGQPRSTQLREPKIAEDEDELVARMTQLASEYGRYGYLRITALLRREGWQVNHKRIERLWRREGLKVPAKQPKRRRLWLHDGSCIRLRPAYRDHVWSYDFVQSRTHNGRAFRMLTLMDEYSRECLAIEDVGIQDVLQCTPRHYRHRAGPKDSQTPVQNSDPMAVESRGDLASRHGSVVRIAVAYS